MRTRKYQQLGLIGCGLMGGSFALALKKARLVRHVVGYSKSPSTTQKAYDLGVIDSQAQSALQACIGSDLILLAVPVSATADMLKNIRDYVRSDTLVMDVGSTKQDVADAARQSLGWNVQYFVPAHPVTGKESAGVAYADANLYRGARVVLTPLHETMPEKLQQAAELWTALGAHLTTMLPQEHDAVMAAVSHMPHLVAFAYINGLLAQGNSAQLLAMGGPGFRDFSRIAAGDAILWRDVLLANRTEVLAQLQHMQTALAQLQQTLENRDGVELERLIAQASKTRAQWRMRE